MSVSKQQYAERVEAGLCGRCGLPRDTARTRCSKCTHKARISSRKYYANHPEAQGKHDKYIEQNLCTRCGKPNPTLYTSCDPCRDIIAERNRNKRRTNPELVRENERRIFDQLRLETLTAYGGSCVCCGEDYIPYLDFDHTNGGGNAHRKDVGTGNQFYYWLRNNNYPPIIQILCSNCHAAKTRKYPCKHPNTGDKE